MQPGNVWLFLFFLFINCFISYLITKIVNQLNFLSINTLTSTFTTIPMFSQVLYIFLCVWECDGISGNTFWLLHGLEILSVIKAPPEVAECWFDEGCQRWREWAWYSKKDHYITSLLHYCAFLLRELGLCFSPFITHFLLSPFPFSCMLVCSLFFCYTPFTTSTSAIEPVSAFYFLQRLSLCFLSVTAFSFSFLFL